MIVPTVAQRRRARLGRTAAVAAVALVGVLAAGSVVAGRWALSTGSTSTPVAGLGAPDAELERMDGSRAALADWRGRPLVVHFWTSWCSACVAEMDRVLDPFHRQAGAHVTVLGVNLQEPEDRALVIAERTGVGYELVRDPAGDTFEALGGVTMPTTVVVDATGEVVARHTGPLTPPDLERLVREHLPSVPVPPPG